MPQSDIEVAVQFALAQSGKPYHAFGDRFGTSYYDCSGLVIRSLYEANIPLPPGISVQNETGNTVSLYNWAVASGGLVSVDKAVRTRGAILIKGKWYGNGPLGHTAISLGDGQEMAAHGVRSGIHVSDVYGGKNYQDGFIIPGVFYKDLQPPVDPKVLEALQKLLEWQHRVDTTPLKQGDTSGDVTVLNQLLIARGLLPTKWRYMNTYTKGTRGAVHHFKQARHLSNADGTKFGGEAAAALLSPR